LGATIAGSNKIVRKFTGLSLFSQGGVAIGLSIMASQHLNNIAVVEGYYLGDVIIFRSYRNNIYFADYWTSNCKNGGNF